MFPLINLGPISLPAPQLILIIGIWIGASLAEKRAEKNSNNSEILSKVIWGAIFAGILGGRLSFVARNYSAFLGQWGSVFSLNPALFDPAGGFLVTLAAGYFLSARKHQANWSLLNDLVPFFAVLAPTIYLSNFAAGAGFGTITGLPWGIVLWGGQRHPVQLYYLFSSLVVLYIVVFKSNAKNHEPDPRLFLFVIYTAGYITILSAFQDPGGNTIGVFRIIQLVSWIIFTSSIFIFNRIRTEGGENAAG
jgi:phosphatidylglycerol:prolipoprotein diacylglycerol transferase